MYSINKVYWFKKLLYMIYEPETKPQFVWTLKQASLESGTKLRAHT